MIECYPPSASWGWLLKPPGPASTFGPKCPRVTPPRELAARLLEETDIVVTPGSSYGAYGEGYIRLSLTTPDEQVEKGCQRLEAWSIPAKGG